VNGEGTQQSPEEEQLAVAAKKGIEVDLAIEVVILLVGGVFFLLYGLLLFPIIMGALPYSVDTARGLFLVLVALQIITMGKTPFGDLRRSWIVVIIGIALMIVGTLGILFPGYLTLLIRILVGVSLVGGGLAGLLQLFASEDRAKTWMKASRILRRLTFAAGFVYVMEILAGITVIPTMISDVALNLLAAVLLLVFGLSLFYLAWCIQKATNLYPMGETKSFTGE
jgi:uncharacterized membrane protein HdeD (DUF308 family)